MTSDKNRDINNKRTSPGDQSKISANEQATKTKGILRSRPRYSHSNRRSVGIVSSSVNADELPERIPCNASTVSGGVTSSSRPSLFYTSSTHQQSHTDTASQAFGNFYQNPALTSRNQARKNKSSNWSLADLVTCSIATNNQAFGNDGDDVVSLHNRAQAQRSGDVIAGVDNVVDLGMRNGIKKCHQPTGRNEPGEVGCEQKNEVDSGRHRVMICSNDESESYHFPGEGIDNHPSDKSNRLKRVENDVDCFDESEVLDDNAEESDTNDSDSESEDSAGDKEILVELGLDDLASASGGHCVEDSWCPNSDRSLATHPIPNTARTPEPRSFRILWETLLRWTTPPTVELVLKYRHQSVQNQFVGYADEVTAPEPESLRTPSINALSPTRNTIDIGASRRAGIMSFLKMNVSRCLSELKKIHKRRVQHQQQLRCARPDFQETSEQKCEIELRTSERLQQLLQQRNVERRLGYLVRTFDSSGPAANLNMKMWRGMTTILIVIAFPIIGLESFNDGSRDETLGSSEDFHLDDERPFDLLPPSVRSLGVTEEEYRYLTQSAMVSLDNTP